MAILVFVLIAFVVPFASSKSVGGQYYVTPNDTKTCVNDLIAWCDGMKYPAEGGSISMVSITIIDSSGYCQALCTTDSEGTNCTKNESPWLSCSNKNQLFYKGNPLTKDSLDNTDNATCETADKIFNDLFLQNDNTTMKRELETGFKQFFRSLEERIATMQRRFSGIFGGGFPFYNNYPSKPNPSDDGDSNTSTVEDHREKE